MFEWFPVLEGIKTQKNNRYNILFLFEWFPVLEGIKTIHLGITYIFCRSLNGSLF